MALSKDWSIFAQDLESKSGVTVIFCYSLKTGERSSAAHTHCQWYTFSLIIFLVWNGTWIHSNSWSCQIFSFCCSKYCIKDMPSSVTQWCLTLRHHGLQHAALPCPSPPPQAYSNWCPTHWWCHPTISSSVIPFSSKPSVPPSVGVFSNESVLCIRWPKYWSFGFSIRPSNEYSGLVSFRIDWFDFLAFQGTLKSLLQHHSSKASVLWC